MVKKKYNWGKVNFDKYDKSLRLKLYKIGVKPKTISNQEFFWKHFNIFGYRRYALYRYYNKALMTF